MPHAATGTWALLIGLLVLVTVFLIIAVWLWRMVLRNNPQPSTGRCVFYPGKLQLKGVKGEVLRAKIHIDGPHGLAFTTFSEESWVVTLPSSGMTPQDAEVIIYTDHAPPTKSCELTLRLLPADFQLPADELRIKLKLRPRRHGESISGQLHD